MSSNPALFILCARCTLGCIKICVECTTTKGCARVHHKLVTLNRYFLQKLSVSKNELLTNQWLSGFNLDFAHSKAGVGNLFAITGRMNCSLSLAGRKFSSFYPKIILLSNYEEEWLLLTYYLCTCLSSASFWRDFVITWVIKILM